MAALQSWLNVIRIPINVAPILQGQVTRTSVLRLVETLYDALPSSTGYVVLSPVLQTHRPGLDNVEMLTQPEINQTFSKFLLALGAWGSKRPKSLVEILNEPEPCGAGEVKWEQLQDGFYRSLRGSDPDLNIVMSAACWDTEEALLRSDLTRYAFDRRVYLTFHFYEPYVFTAQNVPWAVNYTRYTQGLSIFRNCFNAVSAFEAFRSRLATKHSVSDDQHSELERSFSRALAQLLRVKDWAAEIRNRFSQVRAHFATAGVESHRLLVGEFGMMAGAPGYPRAPTQDRLFWIKAVRDAATSSGFLWAYWAAVGPFGIWTDWRSLVPQDASLKEVMLGHLRVSPPACATQ